MRKARFITPTVLFIVIIFTLLISFSCHRSTPDHHISSSNVLALLQEGNKRFHSHQMQHPHTNKQWMSAVSREQHPEAIIVCCSDSRVCPELVFDQGLGDLFVIRSAGNIISPVELGSIEYGVEHLGIHLIVIMGHERCGAIEAFAHEDPVHGYLKTLIDTLKCEPEIKLIHDKSHFIENCVEANVLHMMHLVEADTELHKKIEKKEVNILGAVYNMDNGKVEFLQ